ncbi:carbamoyltransferase HypF [Rhodococcus sp. WMMA185]|uniref:carbamoyltransferase HypF n=1 Tax=Rhodococcus sp. WMMA185 TaxID=679318 RepID=UPI000878D3E8|nr:carbamoyltransferase HypF [Rhodococcus sp. WMMA185]AOW93513.1 carbamoyltransferase HypF [Rhodococcus sp. WMMA185]
MTVERSRITVRGAVQGVGFRPFVARLADDLGLPGHCGNDDVSVFIEVEGQPSSLSEFTRRLRTDAPPMAVIVDMAVQSLPVRRDESFRIVDSRHALGSRTLVSPDMATCADCLRELADPSDRRYRHPFINCTNCGPRFTVITDLPYDRHNTTMAEFPMCEGCLAEYIDPTDRRFHAQPVCCPDCGPRLFAEIDGHRLDGDDTVLTAAQEALRDGKILAVKGLGGFHLVCDAADADAVATLRDRKHRPDKPFAVMAPDPTMAAELCEISESESALLRHPARPIMLLRKKHLAAVADGIAPGIDDLGVMLPYTALHHLLFTPPPGSDVIPPQVLVMTSGNLGGEPLCFDNDDARTRLRDIADMFLMHDRHIAVPCEDSVLATEHNTVLPIRRSRGFAPLPVVLPSRGPEVLAVGAEIKNTFCLTRQDYAFCSAHLGDMGSLESRRAFETSVRQLTHLHGISPRTVVADQHPGYSTRQWAQSYSDRTGTPLHTVQHHHAHVASLMAEHGLVGTTVLGVAFDGTGYGCDKTVWGGEFLLVGPDILTTRRVGHLQAFSLPGGDAAVRNPVRVALALLHEAGVTDSEGLPCVEAIPAAERASVESQLSSGLGCIRTTSVGRLFDGVASLLGVRHRITYEAQAAIELEALARTASQPASLTMEVENDQLRLAVLVSGMVAAVRDGTPPADIALGFHHAVAAATADIVGRAAAANGVTTVGLTGGVFQNRLFLELLRAHWENSGYRVLTHHRVPPNDGGLSLGQAVIGAAAAMRGPRRRQPPTSRPGTGAT